MIDMIRITKEIEQQTVKRIISIFEADKIRAYKRGDPLGVGYCREIIEKITDEFEEKDGQDS